MITNTTRLLLIGLTLFFGTGCRNEEMDPGPRSSLSPAKSCPAQYRFVYSQDISEAQLRKACSELPFSEIEFERTQCYGSCPSFVMRLRATGEAEYLGRKHVARLGSYKGEASFREFGRVCFAIERLKILNLDSEFEASVSDMSTAIIRIKMQGSGKTISISDYAKQGPIELWLLFEALDSLAQKTEWTSVVKE